mgnify:FL=1
MEKQKQNRNVEKHLNLNSKNMTLVTLAAGMGSRYGGLKQLDVIGNEDETIIDFSLFDAINANFTKVVFIVRETILEQVKEVFLSKLKGKVEVDFVCQEVNKIPSEFSSNSRTKPWGTAHALLMAKDVVTTNFCVINADDFYGQEAFLKMANFLENTDQKSYNYSMVGYLIKNTLSKTGTVSRGECTTNNDNHLVEINERTDIYSKNNKIYYKDDATEVELAKNTIASMNFWGFTPIIFEEIENQFHTFLIENHQELKAEFYLPLVVNNLITRKKATVTVLETTSSWMGVTYKEDKVDVVEKIKELKNNKVYPQFLWN